MWILKQSLWKSWTVEKPQSSISFTGILSRPGLLFDFNSFLVFWGSSISGGGSSGAGSTVENRGAVTDNFLVQDTAVFLPTNFHLLPLTRHTYRQIRWNIDIKKKVFSWFIQMWEEMNSFRRTLLCSLLNLMLHRLLQGRKLWSGLGPCIRMKKS